MKDRHLIGFSFSFCMRDILQKKVDIDEVLHIHTACRMQSEADIEQCIAQYMQSYWKGQDSGDVRYYLNKLREDNRISWLASFEPNPMFIGWGRWLSTKNVVKVG